MLSASTSMCGILIGAMIRIAGFWYKIFFFNYFGFASDWTITRCTHCWIFWLPEAQFQLPVTLNHQKFHYYRKSHINKGLRRNGHERKFTPELWKSLNPIILWGLLRLQTSPRHGGAVRFLQICLQALIRRGGTPSGAAGFITNNYEE
jgi:hypothetical protein